jgi:hypothetical protein
MSDGRLAARAARGDSLAFAVLLGRHGDLVRVAGARYFLPGHDRADVEQEARLGLTRRASASARSAGFPFGRSPTMCVRRAVLERADGGPASQARSTRRPDRTRHATDARPRRRASGRSPRGTGRARAAGPDRDAGAVTTASRTARSAERARAGGARSRSHRRHAGRGRGRPARQSHHAGRQRAHQGARRKARDLLALEDAA